METYDEFLVAIDNMANEPDFPKLKSMLKILSGMLDTLVLACEGKELKINPKDTPNHDLIYSFFGSYDYLANKDKAELLVAKLTDLISKLSNDKLFSDLPNRTN